MCKYRPRVIHFKIVIVWNVELQFSKYLEKSKGILALFDLWKIKRDLSTSC